MGLSRKQLLITGIELATGLIYLPGIGQRTSGVISRLYSSYFSDIALPFAAYFLLCASEKSFPALRPWWTKLVLAFGAATTTEILQFSGVYALGKTFDPLDVVAYDTMQTPADIASLACFARLRERRAISAGKREAVASIDPNLPVSDVITASLTA